MNGLRLGVNLDHIATLRQARYATMPDSKNAEPDIIATAAICERAGASGIVAHLRTDRRHIQDRDIDRLRQNIMTKLNLEMGNTPEIVDVALKIALPFGHVGSPLCGAILNVGGCCMSGAANSSVMSTVGKLA